MTRYDHAVDASWAGYGSAEGLVIYPLCFFFHFQENYSNFREWATTTVGRRNHLGPYCSHTAAAAGLTRYINGAFARVRSLCLCRVLSVTRYPAYLVLPSPLLGFSSLPSRRPLLLADFKQPSFAAK